MGKELPMRPSAVEETAGSSRRTISHLPFCSLSIALAALNLIGAEVVLPVLALTAGPVPHSPMALLWTMAEGGLYTLPKLARPGLAVAVLGLVAGIAGLRLLCPRRSLCVAGIIVNAISLPGWLLGISFGLAFGV
jgi:hypothetical protein